MGLVFMRQLADVGLEFELGPFSLLVIFYGLFRNNLLSVLQFSHFV